VGADGTAGVDGGAAEAAVWLSDFAEGSLSTTVA